MPARPLAVEYLGSVFAPSGYGEAARLYVRALLAAGVEVRIGSSQLGALDENAQAQYPGFWKLVDRTDIEPCVRISHKTPIYKREHVDALMGNVKFAGPTISLIAWETTLLPDACVEAQNTYAAVWVPLRWNAEVLRDSGVTVPINVMPHPHDPGKYDQPINFDGDQDERYTFYWIGAWNDRKNPLGVIRAYLYAFGTDDPVRLVIKTFGIAGADADLTATMRQMWPHVKTSPPADPRALQNAYPPIVFVNEPWSREQVDALHLNANCFVALSRAEGWNLPAYEAALWGNHVLYSAIPGHFEWAASVAAVGNATAVPVVSQPCQADPHTQLYTGKQAWFEPDLVDAAAAMQRLARKRPRKRDTRPMLQALSLAEIGKRMRKEIEEMIK